MWLSSPLFTNLLLLTGLVLADLAYRLGPPTSKASKIALGAWYFLLCWAVFQDFSHPAWLWALVVVVFGSNFLLKLKFKR